MLKIIVGFFTGITVAGMLLFGIQSAIPIRAQSENETLISDNFSLVHLLPDIEKIYHQALAYPVKEAEKKIYDKDIANFYRGLMEKTALDKIE